MSLVVYRRRPSEELWHFCENCPSWPDRPEEFEEPGEPPPSLADCCAECRQLRDKGNCRLRLGSGGFT